MRKIIPYLFICFIFGCAGYEPIFSSKNLDFYISDIENLNSDDITRKISKRLKDYKIEDANKEEYKLKITSEKNEYVASKDSKGDPLVFVMSVKTKIEVLYNEKSINILNLSETFNFNNQSNKFDLSKYKKNIEENLINKIYENLIIKIQTL